MKLPPVPAPLSGSRGLALAAAVFFTVLLGLFGLTVLVQSRTNARVDRNTHALDQATQTLHTTQVLTCKFIEADASARRAQASNSLKGLLRADRKLAQYSDRLLKLFKPTEKKTPKASRAGLLLFEDYIRASGNAARARAKTTAANVRISKLLAAKAVALSNAFRECS